MKADTCHDPDAGLWNMAKINVRLVEQIVGFQIQVVVGRVPTQARIDNTVGLVFLYVVVAVGVGACTVLETVVQSQVELTDEVHL